MVNYVLCGLISSVWSIMFRVVRHLIHGVNYLPCGSSSFVWFTIVVFYLPYGPHVPWCLFFSVWSIIQENVCNMYIFNTVILKQLENLEGASELRELAEFWYPFSSIGAFFKNATNLSWAWEIDRTSVGQSCAHGKELNRKDNWIIWAGHLP